MNDTGYCARSTLAGKVRVIRYGPAGASVADRSLDVWPALTPRAKRQAEADLLVRGWAVTSAWEFNEATGALWARVEEAK